jgi:predicted ribosomally synthesized peptide with SipW-like signal peptide
MAPRKRFLIALSALWRWVAVMGVAAVTVAALAAFADTRVSEPPFTSSSVLRVGAASRATRATKPESPRASSIERGDAEARRTHAKRAAGSDPSLGATRVLGLASRPCAAPETEIHLPSPAPLRPRLAPYSLPPSRAPPPLAGA